MVAPMRSSVVVKIVLGGALTVLLLPCSALGVGMMVAPNQEGDQGVGLAVLIMSVIMFGIPATILLALGLKGRAYDRKLKQVVALGMASQRLPLQQVAADLGVEFDEARQLVLDAVHQGKLFGRLDIEHGVFISGAAHQGVQQLQMTCRNCGGSSMVVVTPGSMSACQFCGARLA
jgi:hypothetical protein